MALLGTVALAGACSFDASGGPGMPMLAHGDDAEMDVDDDAETGEPESVDSAADSGADETGPATDGATTGGVDDDDRSDSSGAGPSADDGASPTDDSGGEVTCPTEYASIHWVDDAEVTAPANLVKVSGVEGEPNIAISTVSDAGKVTFSLSLPCAGEYYVWGLVWDYYPGAWSAPDPDSFHVGTGGDEFVWHYGCQTFGLFDALTWQSLQRLDAQPCAVQAITLEAPAAGDYVLAFRNRESGSGSVVAGIAAIVISTDPSTDPYALYAP